MLKHRVFSCKIKRKCIINNNNYSNNNICYSIKYYSTSIFKFNSDSKYYNNNSLLSHQNNIQKYSFHSTMKLFCSQEKELINNDDSIETSNKIVELVDEISNLNLKEIAEFTTLLKQKLNLPDTAMMMGSPMGAMPQQTQTSDDTDAPPQGIIIP